MTEPAMATMGSVPIPDPTKLTTDAVAALEKQLRRELTAVDLLWQSRIDGVTRTASLAAGTRDEVVADFTRRMHAEREFITAEIGRVRDVMLEKFAAVDSTFASNALALTAALAAQKEAAAEQNKSNTLAITKSEQATKETISANAQQNQASMTSLADRVDDLKGRLDRGEGNDAGTRESTGQAIQRAATVAATQATAATAARAQITIAISLAALIIAIVLPLILKQ